MRRGFRESQRSTPPTPRRTDRGARGRHAASVARSRRPAEYARRTDAANLTPRPAEIPWEVAGALFVAGVTGVATVRALAPTPGEAVVIAWAGGGVRVFAVQLAVRTGACVIALASERHHAWLRERGPVPVAYGDGVRERIMVAAEETPVVAF